MKLRRWQSNCVRMAFKKYLSGEEHFLCLATPGAGKTLMAAELARQLWERNEVDLVLCFSPSVNVAYDFRKALEQRTALRFDGALGAHGRSMTYQAMLSLNDDFWELFDRNRIFVIFDEIHHCAGQELARANSWGQKIIQEIQGRAAFTLALTGTPWRSDRIPISLSSYCVEGNIHCDFTYGLSEAVNDRVCRIPKISLIDNDAIQLHGQDEMQSFSSISEFLSSSSCSYQSLIEHADLVEYILRTANRHLMTIRKINADAGGLIVASNVEHAYRIAALLKRTTGEAACVVTYQSEEAQHQIEQFKRSSQKWIVSVGMISEGTNIPRLQVCCHLTRIRTEMHFRQVLGRVLRQTGTDMESGQLFVPAATEFVNFAKRIGDEIPGTAIIEVKKMKADEFSDSRDGQLRLPQKTEAANAEILLGDTGNVLIKNDLSAHLANFTFSNEAKLHLFGRYRTELLSLMY